MTQTLSSYYIFYIVARYGNISKAANELYISQPAISKSIQKLEESLNCKLFTRSSRGVILTDEGNLLYEYVKKSFHALYEGEHKLKESLDLGAGKIKIGVSSTLCKYLLLPYLKEFNKEYPNLSISIQCQSTNDTLKLLDSNVIDIGLVGRPEIFKNFRFETLQTIEDIFVATPEYYEQLKKESTSECDLLSHANLILLDSKNMTRQYIDQYLIEQDIMITESIEISNMDLIIDFAKQGLGVSAVIKEFVKNDLMDNTLIEIPLAKHIPTREVGFAFKAEKADTHSIRTFVDYFKSIH